MRSDNFVSGMLTGAALGALVVLAMAPQVRRPMMDGAMDMGTRMKKMWKRNDMGEMVENMVPDTM
ncbi:MAG TPA: hypothetical protein VNT01_13400 [Symbiobacteriaceae bacterium]|nr:hypothetical protein [Symbiobacteriaceae bacterium]